MPAGAGSVARDELVAYIDELLEAAAFEDYGPNGLQVEGRPLIRRMATGVSACAELFRAAEDRACDAVLVHHGLLWQKDPLVITGVRRRRLGALLASDMSLLAYHLPLDAHSELGNNALGARALGLDRLQPFGLYGGRSIGVRGELAAVLSPQALCERCESAFGQPPLLLGDGPREIGSVALVSGGAQALLHEAIAVGVDAFVTGEASEWVTNLAREAGIHYLAAGHYATERLGVEALGRHLAERFGLTVDFVDVPNPV